MLFLKAKVVHSESTKYHRWIRKATETRKWALWTVIWDEGTYMLDLTSDVVLKKLSHSRGRQEKKPQTRAADKTRHSNIRWPFFGRLQNAGYSKHVKVKENRPQLKYLHQKKKKTCLDHGYWFCASYHFLFQMTGPGKPCRRPRWEEKLHIFVLLLSGGHNLPRLLTHHILLATADFKPAALI